MVGFSALLALFVAALALGVGLLLRAGIRDAALSGAEQTGRLFARLEVGREEFEKGRLTSQARADLDAAVRTSSPALGLARVWGGGSELLHTTAPGEPAARPSGRALDRALHGSTEVVISGSSLSVYVPVGRAHSRAVLQVDMPYGPVRAEISRRTGTLALLVALGALLFYTALLPTVLRASRALAALHAARQSALQARLRRAMRDGEVELHYQPKLDLETGRVKGLEALLRWRLRDGSFVAPCDFIPLVEPTAVMGPLTLHVFDLAARQSAEWAREGLILDIAVNVSAYNLRDSGLPDRLAQSAAAHGLEPAGFTLEVTEGAMSTGPDQDFATLAALRARGFKLSIDDFGTGESSLSRLHMAEFQEVKIDRSFLRELEEPGDPVMLAGIIGLARALGASVVAEGVESETAQSYLAELGCDTLQGYHLARPLPPGELTTWLDSFHAAEPRELAAA